MSDLALKAISTYNGNLHNGLTTALEAVVAMCLEEAAKECAYHWTPKECAAAIRALKEDGDE